jgi:hypothetical protein
VVPDVPPAGATVARCRWPLIAVDRAVRPKDPVMLRWALRPSYGPHLVAGGRLCGSGSCHPDRAMPTDEIPGSGRRSPPRTGTRPYLPLCARPVHTASCNYTYAYRWGPADDDGICTPV